MKHEMEKVHKKMSTINTLAVWVMNSLDDEFFNGLHYKRGTSESKYDTVKKE